MQSVHTNGLTGSTDGPKPTRCAKCKRWDWDEGYLSHAEKQLRRGILQIESTPTRHGNLLPSITTDICATFLSLYPRPTLEELETVLHPLYYLGPWAGDYPSDWVPDPTPDEPYQWRLDTKNNVYEERERKEKILRHDLMQHIIDSRGGTVNKDSLHYQYYEGRKQFNAWLDQRQKSK